MSAKPNNRVNAVEKSVKAMQLALTPSKPMRGTAGEVQRFPNAGGRTVFDLQFSLHSIELPAAAPEEKLAAGVLAQAGRDLRRFQAATKGIEREIYLDAYSWIMANDFSWPYSFVNICKLMHLCPEIIRAELLERSLARRGHLIRLREGLSNLLHTYLIAFSRSLIAQTENS
jgi:hypothetical protein